MALTNSLVVLIYCCATADILTKLLQQCFLFFIVVVIPGHNLGNSQVSVNRTIGPTLVYYGQLELWLLWQLIVSIDLQWEKWKLEISTVSLGIIEFYFYRNVY